MSGLTTQLDALARSVPPSPAFAEGVLRHLPAGPAARGRTRVSRRWLLCAAVPVAACALAGIGLWGGLLMAAPVAFAEVAKTIRHTHSVTLTLVTDGQKGHVTEKEGAGSRVEMPGGVTYLYDAKAGLSVTVDEGRRLWVITAAKRPIDVYDWLKKLGGVDATRIGESAIGGKKVVVFRADLPLPAPGELLARTTFWVDPETRLPVRVEQEPLNPAPGAGVPRKVVLEDIRFDTVVDDSAFNATAPAGFQVRDNRSTPTTRTKVGP